MTYDLKKYSTAFELLGQGGNYKTQVPDFIRQAMVFVGLNLDFEANENKEAVQNLFGSTSGLQWNDSAILKCLSEIRSIGSLSELDHFKKFAWEVYKAVKGQPCPTFFDAGSFQPGVPLEFMERAISYWADREIMKRMGLGELTVCLTHEGIAEIRSWGFTD
jgi:hypothetical protein